MLAAALILKYVWGINYILSEQELTTLQVVELKRECLSQAIRIYDRPVYTAVGTSETKEVTPELLIETAKKFESYLNPLSQE